MRRVPIISVLVVAALVGGGLSAAKVPNGCKDSTRRAARLSPAAARAAVVCLFNRQRTGRGLPPLKQAGKLDRSAQGWTDHMVASGDFSHGNDFASRFTAEGYHWRAAGENIAAGQETPAAVVAAWMASTGHCRNILDPDFRDVGIGLSTKPVRWDTAPVTWTADFGTRMGQSLPSHDTKPADGCPYR